jgi:hypothetical protein
MANRYLQPVLHRLQRGQLRTVILGTIPSAVNGLTTDAGANEKAQFKKVELASPFSVPVLAISFFLSGWPSR